MTMNFCGPRARLVVAFAATLVAGSLSSAMAAPPVDDAEAQARDAWRETIIHTPVPEQACFHAAYPETKWTKVACVEAPARPYLPHRGPVGDTVGDGADYALQVPGLISAAVGTFPAVTVKTERDGGKNNYSLQLNSNFMSGTAACDGATVSGCLSWLQYVYASNEKSAFMQYWLINYGKCPKGWNTFSPDCYKNSAAVAVPKIAITELKFLKLSGTAVVNGSDTFVFTSETDAYTTSGSDSVVDLATAWNGAEFNVIGDGGGSEAVFGNGTSITVNIAVTDGSTAAPTCAANAGTTGETNNLNLGACTVAGGATPSIQFVESN